MFKQTLRIMMVLLLAVTMLAGGGGVAQAYLTPSNPAVLAPNPDALHMPTSYTADYTATPNPAYVIGPGSVPDYLTNPNWAYSPPLTKFVDPLPGLCIPLPPDGANCDSNGSMASKNIPVAIPDIVTYPGTDYYELELVQFAEPMHSDMLANPTTLRGYRQVGVGTHVADVNGCTDPIINPADPNNCTHIDDIDFANSQAHYLGPIIVAVKDRPVRVKFINKLPIGPAGDLFVPVDVTIMGAGDYDVAYSSVTKDVSGGAGTFTQNRAELHLHGGRTPWISDGTPHQWITPAGEATNYPKGVSVENVPDMPPAGPGEQTYYWTNQQSARLMFYHDHAWGITRVNVYVGEAAGYIIRDQTEQDLVTAGVLPVDEIPLVIQDKTFVDATTIAATDPTWAWGTQPWGGTPGAAMTPVTGDLWWPHVYMPAQNPFDITGIAPMGRWAYGPYFWPATQNEFQPVPNPYYHADCDPNNPLTPGSFGGFCQAPEIPSTPNPSWGAEAFMDTPVVNGTAYPIMTVDPKPYRLRILNAAHDRFFNLSLFLAADKTTNTTEVVDPLLPATALCDGTVATTANCTEVKMLPAVVHAGFPATWPADGRPGGVPDFTTRGPDWIMIGTEGGFLPQPVVIPPQPVNWNADVTTFNAGNVNAGSLILGPAERADVIVDFSAFAGKTLILYNDAPAPWPALDPHYDYYTGAPDNTAMGGYGPIAAGLGPNTRTVMQIVVNSGTGATFNLAALQNAFDPAVSTDGVFRKGQDPIIVAQGDMNPTGDPAHYEAFPFDDSYNAGAYMQDFSAYNRVFDPVTPFPTTFPYWGIARINDTAISFRDVSGGLVEKIPLQPKAIQDEQGETFDMFGRMRAGLGLQLIQPAAGQVGFVVQTYSDPSTEILEENGIQVWKITHNGVDTHPVHFHLFDVQVLNRVGWDGFIRLPDPTEIGWKDTVRISPLEDTIVAIKPITPRLPFGIPESVRPLNPATSIGSMTEMTPIDPATGDVRNPGDPGSNGNEIVSLDWEYVWHCHILSHEENDMMRPISFKFQEWFPFAPTLQAPTVPGPGQVDLVWTDPTAVNFLTQINFGNPGNEIGFRVERAISGSGLFEAIGTTLANATQFSDLTAASNTVYDYRVVAFNAAGDGAPSNIRTTATSNTAIISVTVGNGGTVTPPGPSVFVTPGLDQPFVIAANTGYHILDVVVDGASLGANTTNYTFTNVQVDHTLGATFSPFDNALFVEQVYLDFLNRLPDATEAQNWTDQLASGLVTRAQFVEQIMFLPEFEQAVAPIDRLYSAYFLRIPDYAGLMYWVNRYKTDMTLTQISDYFALSPEFIARYGTLTNAEFVTQLYFNIFNRVPDPGGFAFWTGVLDAGTWTRGQVVLFFSQSPENLQLTANDGYVTMSFVGLLRRVPDQASLDSWVASMEAGNSGLDLINSILGGAEYAARFGL